MMDDWQLKAVTVVRLERLESTTYVCDLSCTVAYDNHITQWPFLAFFFFFELAVSNARESVRN